MITLYTFVLIGRSPKMDLIDPLIIASCTWYTSLKTHFWNPYIINSEDFFDDHRWEQNITDQTTEMLYSNTYNLIILLHNLENCKMTAIGLDTIIKSVTTFIMATKFCN